MPGVVLLVAACMSSLLLSLVLSQRATVPGWLAAALLILALGLLALYIRRARHVRRADHPARAVRGHAFAIPNVMNVLANLAGFAILLLTPYYLTNVLKLSAVMSGLVLALAFSAALPARRASAWLVRQGRPQSTAFVGIVLIGPAPDSARLHEAETPLLSWCCC